MPPVFSAFVQCEPGLEGLLDQELKRVGVSCDHRHAAIPGMLRANLTLEAVYRVNLHSALASRVLIQAGMFEAHDFTRFERRLRALDASWWKATGAPLRVDAVSRASRLYHERALEERARIILAPEASVTPGIPEQRILLRMIRDRCQVLVDASGEPLGRRGYRLATGKAPLPESLAAALLDLSGWTPGMPLIDPLCGSGTILLEAARRVAGIPPGWDRSFACEAWPGFEPTVAKAIREAVSLSEAAGPPTIHGGDRDAGAVESARANAERAGIADRVALFCRPLSATEFPPGPGAVVTNPPYGRRIRGGPDLRNLYASLGNLVRDRAPDWRVTLLGPSRELVAQLRLPLEPVLSFRHGGLTLSVWT